MKAIIITNNRGEVIRRFKTISEAAKAYGVGKSTMAYRARTKLTINNETTKYEDNSIYEQLIDKEIEKIEKACDGNFTFDEKKHTKVKYEVIRGIVCITPCPHLVAPKPLVGSARCQSCSHFKYKDKDNKIVICSGHKFLNA